MRYASLPRFVRTLSLFAGLVLSAISFASASTSAKLDATLRSLLTPAIAEKRLASRTLVTRTVNGRERLAVVGRVSQGGVEKLRTLGVEIGSIHGDVVTLGIEPASLTAVAALDEVVYLEAARRLPKRLNASVPLTKANLLRSGTAPSFTGLTGKGVIVGIIDDGMDFRHRDFRNPDGSTRLLALWDQSTTGASGSPPTGFNYGGECTVSMLNQAINGDQSACRQASTGGHGTHVGGIAAGNGQGTGNNQPAYRFVGMAPEADILSANAIEKDTGNGSSDTLLDAVAWMKQKAAAANKPLVINMSLGSYYGARDGTSNVERGLSNAGAAGVILVAAAGNEGNAPIRASAPIAQGQTVTTEMEIPASQDKGTVEMWYPGTNAYGISVQGPDCAVSAVANPGDAATPWDTPCGRITVTTSGVQAINDDRQVRIEFEAGGSPLKKGVWKINVIGTVVAPNSPPISMICADVAGELEFRTNTTPVTSQILTETASATRVIGVAAMFSNAKWTTAGGPVDRAHPIGNVTGFSSRGPRRNCSNLSKCPPAMKPEITAPGAEIMSALSADLAKAPDPTTRETDGVHYATGGTSMAAPHVAGAVALLLQRRPSLTPEQAREALFANIQTNQFTSDLAVYSAAAPYTPGTQNFTWGYGILDVQKAANALLPPSGLGDSDNVTGLWWNAAESGWGVNLNHQGNILFGTLFTYGTDNQGMWLVMSNGARQPDGSFRGELYRTTGPAFSANPFTPLTGANVAQVGTMTLTFTSKSAGTLQYTVDGVSVTKQITPQAFGKLQVCSNAGTAVGARAARTNYTDLWWVPTESGWGINVTHQDDILFATLFNYAAGAGTTNRGMWLVMSAGTRQGDGSYLGDLYQTTGPVFNASPFTPITGANVTRVGSMRFSFANGERGTLTYDVNGTAVTKTIAPQVFGSSAPSCTRGQ